MGLAGLALLYVAPAAVAIGRGGAGCYNGDVPAGPEGWAWLGLPLLQYGCGVAMRLLLAARFRFRPADALLHPLSVALQIAIGLQLGPAGPARRGPWKGRTLGNPPAPET